MALSVKIEVYEGPLDLLLQLIKKSEVDIYDIPIAQITDQYMEYLSQMEELDLDVASEFLVMAATLLEIKSKMLLPKRKNEDSEEAMDIDEDPRKELVEKLVEYKKYKEFASELREIEKHNMVYFKPPEIIDDIESKEVLFKNINLESLMFAFKRIMDNYEKKFNNKSAIPENINYDEYKIEDKMAEIRTKLLNQKKVNFNCFFETAESKMEIIVIFLAMLELIKLEEINVIQNGNFEDIIIEGQEE